MIKFLDLQKVTQRHGAEIRKAIQRVVESGWYLQGSENKRFEKNYAAYIGSQYCVGCGNGLDALIWIYRAYIELGVMHPGDEVIVPANTFIASILALTENQLVPVLVEPRFDTLELDEDTIEKHITSRTRSVLLVHLYGKTAKLVVKIRDSVCYRSYQYENDNKQCKYPHQNEIPLDFFSRSS